MKVTGTISKQMNKNAMMKVTRLFVLMVLLLSKPYQHFKMGCGCWDEELYKNRQLRNLAALPETLPYREIVLELLYTRFSQLARSRISLMVKSWMVIGAVTIVTAVVGNRFLTTEDIRWFRHLQRPRWLTFENAIPVIWTIVFICAAVSAVLTWNAAPGSPRTWGLMGLYFLLELLTIAYTPGMCKTKSLRVGTAIGAAVAIASVILAVLVFPVSRLAAGLLLPYILWSPIGTYTTQAMIPLNPSDR